MKATVISVLVLTVLLIAWFWPVQKEAQSVIIVADLSSQLAERDRHLATDLPVWLNEAAAQAHQRLNILFLDSHQPAGKLVEQLETHLASGVHIVMGCGDSACVRTLIPALERHKAVLLYPASSEGLIDSDQVVHLGFPLPPSCCCGLGFPLSSLLLLWAWLPLPPSSCCCGLGFPLPPSSCCCCCCCC